MIRVRSAATQAAVHAVHRLSQLPMYNIEIANSLDCLSIDESFLGEVARRTLETEEVAAAEISLALVDHATIRRLNKQYLKHDEQTDVLSFLFNCDETATAAEPVPRGRGRRIDGEVIVNTELAREVAGRFGLSARDEVVLYLVHGLLHLMGYDDCTQSEKQLMRSRERAVLQLWNLKAGADS